MTAEAVATMTREEAERVTERIRLKLDSAANVLDSLGALVADAYQRRADLAMGYKSWAEYADAEFAEQTRNLAAPIRRELVGRLTEAGMSTRAIAPAVGGSHMQVQRDRAAGVTERYTSAPDPLAEEKAEGRVVKLTGPGSLLHSEPVERIDYETGEVLTAKEPAEPLALGDEVTIRPLNPSPTDKPIAGTITGLDGKTYTRPEPQPAAAPKRRPITDQFFDAAYDVNRRVESLHKLTRDDRFPQNAQKVAQKHLNDLLHSRDLLQQVIDQLS